MSGWRSKVFLVRHKEHLITANVLGLGWLEGLALGGLDEIDHTGAVDSSNERTQCTD